MIEPILIVVFISFSVLTVSLVSIFGWYMAGEKRDLNRRLAEITVESGARITDIPSILKGEELSQIPFLDRQLRKSAIAYRLQRLIEEANLSIKVGQLVLFMLVLASVGLIFTIRSHSPLLMAASVCVFGSLPILAVVRIRNKRIKTFEQQFPDALDMMRNAIRAGFALNRALQLVGTESPDPVGMEFRKASDEISLGIPLRDALLNLNNRIDSMDLKLFSTAVIIQRESGGNLNEILFKLSSTIRARFKLAGQIKVFTAQGRLSQLILGLLPIGFGMVISVMNPEYITVLFREPLGHTLLIIAVFMQLAGYIVIRNILRIRLQ